MSSIEKYRIGRYSLTKDFIMTGELSVLEDGPLTELTYKDTDVEETDSDTAHPMMALLRLRNKLETKYKSIIGCNGCRIDTTLRVTGIDVANVIRDGNIHQDDWIAIFEPTNEVAKLCTVKEHEQAYDEWCETWGPNS